MAYKEPKFDSKSIKAFLGGYNDGVGKRKQPSTKKKTIKNANTKKK